jgi:hypothetical protein
VIAKRQTADHKTVMLWSDGGLTTGMHGHIVRPGRTPETIEARRDAGWLVMGWVELYRYEEVPELFEAALWAVRCGKGSAEMRARMAAPPVLRWVWTTLHADRNGKPTLQVCVLPRLRWPGLAVWRERGKYSVCQEMGHKTGTYAPLGIEFTNLAGLTAYLLSTN